MNWDQIAGDWKQFTGKPKETWAKLTDNDLTTAAGKRDQLAGFLQQRYGYAKDQAEKELDEFSKVLKPSGTPRLLGTAARSLRGHRPQSPRGTLMPFYVSPGPRGILFEAGMIWTSGMGSLTYWWTNQRGPEIPVPRSLPHAIPLGRALKAHPGQRSSLPLERARASHFSGIQAMDTDDAMGDELDEFRRACVELGADEEMTELVLASHCHDRTLLDSMTAAGNDLRDYARYKLAIWEAIFNEDEKLLPNRTPSRGVL